MRRWAAIGSFIAALAAATPARADRIDGNWCDASGHSLSIDGPNIKTPGGAAVTGDYARHEFAYVAPKPDNDAGQTVYLRLFDDNDMASVHIKDGLVADQPVVWHRCEPVS